MTLPQDGDRAPATGFWIGGYEGADHVNGHGLPLDMARASGHWDRLEEDHRLAAEAGIRCVRESIGWRLCEDAGGAIDLTRAVRIQHSARRHGLQVLWTLMHYGLPGDLCLHDDAMVPRLARFAAEVARVLGPGEALPPVFTPVNEIGFLAWAASQPLMFEAPNNLPGAVPDGGPDAWRESSRVSGYATKRRLARAAIGAMEVIKRTLPDARFLHVEPLVHVVAPCARRDLRGLATQIAGWQWQAWDLLAGRTEPGLGGRPGWLDLIGVNHYHSSQWEVDTEARLDWARRDPRRRPLRVLLRQTWHRYRRPLVVAETSHVGVGRGDWLHEMADEVRAARTAGVPVQGLCIYPLVDRPDWQDPVHWHRSGLWHVDAQDPALPRQAEPLAMAALRAWQQVLPQPLPVPPHAPQSCRAGQEPATGQPPRVLLAFSHRRWEGPRHRARHLMELLARPSLGWQVILVEPPVEAPVPRLDCRAAGPALQVLTPGLPGAASPFRDGQLPALQALLGHFLARRRLAPAVVWTDTPLAAPLARSLRPSAVVYDGAADHGSQAGAARMEAALLAEADLVFTAGTELAAARAALAGHRLRPLPHGVDLAAFTPVAPPGDGRRDWASMEAEAVAGPVRRAAGTAAAGPWLGFAGTIDARTDFALLASLADARPGWQFMLVGPVRVDEARLPRRPNLHWLGSQPYALMPALMASWRVVLLPRVQAAAAHRAVPLQVLEALAAGLPVVAAGLAEGPSWEAAGVHAVAAEPGAVVRACERLLAETADHAARRRHAARQRLQGRSWPEVAARLHDALETLLRRRSGVASAAESDPPRVQATSEVEAHTPADTATPLQTDDVAVRATGTSAPAGRTPSALAR